MNQVVADKLANLNAAPRCGARNRAGTPCQCPAMRDRKRCRLHGGKSTGAPRGTANGNYTDGHWTSEAQAERKLVRHLLKTTMGDKP